MTTLSRLTLSASVLCMLAAPMLASGARAESKPTGSAAPVASTQAAGAQTPAKPAQAGVVTPSGTQGKAAPEAKGKANATQAATPASGTRAAGAGTSGGAGTPATTVR